MKLRAALGTLYGNNASLDLFKIHWIEEYQTSMLSDLNDPSGAKRDMPSIVSAAMLGPIGTASSAGLNKLATLVDEAIFWSGVGRGGDVTAAKWLHKMEVQH
ncbi:MAG TPA: hypothetical protein VN150_03740 [Ochrobactrum sp.]|nr:hypothetical protein [Ochrobactrum sp.]